MSRSTFCVSVAESTPYGSEPRCPTASRPRDALMMVLSQVNPARAFPYLREMAAAAAAEDAIVAIIQLDEFAFRSPTATSSDKSRAEGILRVT